MPDPLMSTVGARGVVIRVAQELGPLAATGVDDLCRSYLTVIEQRDALTAKVQAILEQQRWRRLDEEQPVEKGWIQVFNGDVDSYTGYWVDCVEYAAKDMKLVGITHWRPLPQDMPEGGAL